MPSPCELGYDTLAVVSKGKICTEVVADRKVNDGT